MLEVRRKVSNNCCILVTAIISAAVSLFKKWVTSRHMCICSSIRIFYFAPGVAYAALQAMFLLGKGEMMRYLFTDLGLDYEDKFYNSESWPALKPEMVILS